MSTPSSFDELARRLDEVLAGFTVASTVEEARQACRAARIGEARIDLTDAVALLEQRQSIRREALAAERSAKEALDDALADASWRIDAELVEEAGKTYFVEGDRKRLIAAADRSSWAKTRARKDPAVIAATKAAEVARQRSEKARDDVDLSERQIAACERQVDAAIAQLATYRRALPNPPTPRSTS